MSLLDDYVGSNSTPVAQTNGGTHDSGLSMFRVEPVSIPGTIEIVSAVVKNNILVIATTSNKLLRIDLSNPAEIQDLEVPKLKGSEAGTIQRIFLDDTGQHVLATTEKGVNWYLHIKLSKAARIKSKGVIECVGWNSAGTITATKEILLGLSGGSIVETWLEPIEGFNKSVERYSKQVHSLSSGDAVTGIYMYSGQNVRDRHVLVSSGDLLQHFRGTTNVSADSAVLQPVFSGSPGTQAFDKAISASSLVGIDDLDSPAGRYFAWLCQAGVLHGPAPGVEPGDTSFEDCKLLGSDAMTEHSARFMELSTFHIMVLSGKSFQAFNRYNARLIHDERLSSRDSILGMTADPIQQTYWMFSRTELFEIVLTNEKRDMWDIFLKQKKYDAALAYAATQEQKDAIYSHQADALLRKQQYFEAAEIYAKSNVAIEQVALKLLDVEERDALRAYLLRKLDGTKKQAEMQRTILSTWILELFMSKFTSIEDIHNNMQESRETPDTSEIEREYTHFINKHKADLDKEATYTLINSYGRRKELLVFADAIEDYAYIVNHHLQQDRYTDVLELLVKHPNLELTYSTSTQLLSHAPRATVELWMRLPAIDPTCVLPAILAYSTDKTIAIEDNQAVRYLLFITKHQDVRDQSVHNALLGIYARDCGSDEKELLSYLERQGKEPCFDPDFGLRQCKQYGRILSSIFLYSNMGLFEEAVQFALQHEKLQLAGTIANKVEDNLALRKKLWLMIARKTLSQPDGVKAAIELSKQSDVLRIEDLVPHFEAATTVDEFRDEICNALEDYTRKINSLRREMDESSQTAGTISQNIADLQKRFAIIQVGEQCYTCHRPLMERQFYVFPCQHTFHSDCLIKAALKTAAAYQRRRIAQLQGQISRLTTALAQPPSEDRKMSSTLTQQLAAHRSEMDDIVAAECMLCGSFMIRSIDEGFAVADDRAEAAEAATWVI